MKIIITINLLMGILLNLLMTTTTQATSLYAEPSNGTSINFGDNVVTTAQASVTIFLTGGGAAKTQDDSIKGIVGVTNITCNYDGQNASNFSILTPMPAGPIAFGESLDINLSASVYGNDSLLTATLICNYQFGTFNGSFTWPVQVSGISGTPAQIQVVPSLNIVGVILLVLILLAGFVFSTIVRRA